MLARPLSEARERVAVDPVLLPSPRATMRGIAIRPEMVRELARQAAERELAANASAGT